MKHTRQNYCVFGGQYGSEGKGSVGEFLIRTRLNGRRLAVIGDGGPNSGHTNSLVKTRQLPCSSAWADDVFIGPDAAIDIAVLEADIATLNQRSGKTCPMIHIHENAAIVASMDLELERSLGLEERVGSTVTGGGMARSGKAVRRSINQTARYYDDALKALGYVTVQSTDDWVNGILGREKSDWMVLFECSQGVLLDLNLGRYPYVTSRTTVPQAVIARNGLSSIDWTMCGTFRCHPIRTGGNTGPTGASETTWEELNVPKEQASVTGRIRRVFNFSEGDFRYSTTIAPCDEVYFTHCDYLQPDGNKDESFINWCGDLFDDILVPMFISYHPSEFYKINSHV